MNKIPKEIEEWVNETKPLMEKYNLFELMGYQKSNNKELIFVFLAILFSSMVIGGAFYYGVFTGAFKSTSNVSQEVNLEPNINISNDYELNAQTDNEYKINNNYTIYVNNVVCPTP